MTTSMNSREKKLQKEKDELEKDNAALREKVSSLKLEVKSLTDSKSSLHTRSWGKDLWATIRNAFQGRQDQPETTQNISQCAKMMILKTFDHQKSLEDCFAVLEMVDKIKAELNIKYRERLAEQSEFYYKSKQKIESLQEQLDRKDEHAVQQAYGKGDIHKYGELEKLKSLTEAYFSDKLQTLLNSVKREHSKQVWEEIGALLEELHEIALNGLIGVIASLTKVNEDLQDAFAILKNAFTSTKDDTKLGGLMSSFFKNFREKDFSKISEDECIKFEAFMNMKALLDIGRQKFINFVKQEADKPMKKILEAHIKDQGVISWFVEETATLLVELFTSSYAVFMTSQFKTFDSNYHRISSVDLRKYKDKDEKALEGHNIEAYYQPVLLLYNHQKFHVLVKGQVRVSLLQ